jgi:uncharacterized protein YjeT (DUF2065 family)
MAAFVLVGFLAFCELWPFDAEAPTLRAEPSLWQILFSDQATLGFARLALVGGSLFVIGSVVARISHNEWLRKVGSAETEKLNKARGLIWELEEQLKAVTAEKDEYRKMVEDETAPE